MKQPEILRFSGFEASIGPLLVASFAAVCALLAAGLAALWFAGQVAEIGFLAAAAVVAALAVWLGLRVRADLRRFRFIEIHPDNTWKLVSPLGRVLHTLEPTAPRAVDTCERNAWLFLGAPRRVRFSWLEIELPDGRRFASTTSTPKLQAPALEALARHIREANP